jgi:hypothetical protein
VPGLFSCRVRDRLPQVERPASGERRPGPKTSSPAARRTVAGRPAPHPTRPPAPASARTSAPARAVSCEVVSGHRGARARDRGPWLPIAAREWPADVDSVVAGVQAQPGPQEDQNAEQQDGSGQDVPGAVLELAQQPAWSKALSAGTKAGVSEPTRMKQDPNVPARTAGMARRRRRPHATGRRFRPRGGRRRSLSSMVAPALSPTARESLEFADTHRPHPVRLAAAAVAAATASAAGEHRRARESLADAGRTRRGSGRGRRPSARAVRPGWASCRPANPTGRSGPSRPDRGR